jgi:calcineurin-like phosphoesterase family protein
MDYIISDLHIKHYNILKFENRPFRNIEEHDNTIINNWNNIVTDKDRVFLLGDVMFTHKKDEVLSLLLSLNGKITILLGNHDKPLCKLFYSGKYFNRNNKIFIAGQIYETKVLINKKYEKVVLSHYPILSWNANYHGRKHFYGHVHSKLPYKNLINLSERKLAYNVSAEILNFKPRTFDEVIKINDNL